MSSEDGLDPDDYVFIVGADGIQQRSFESIFSVWSG
jgi:hypothetical protein